MHPKRFFEVIQSVGVDLDLGSDTTLCDVVTSFPLDATTDGIISYEWQNGDTDPLFDVITSGTYELMAVDTNGCPVNDEISVQFVDTPEPDLGTVDTLCDQETITLSPDLQNSQPLWQDGSTDPTFEVTESGQYWIELNNSGCRASDTINIEYFDPIVPNASSTSIICATDCNGTASVAPSGGSGTGYMILWSNGSTDSELVDLCPGLYTVTITDSRGCTAEETVEVVAPDPLEMVVNFEDIECYGDMDGSISSS